MNTPPPFDDDFFYLWKAIFENFIIVNDFEMWDILNNGLFIPIFSFKEWG